MTCRSLKEDLIGTIELREYFDQMEKKGKVSSTIHYSLLKHGKWTGGFLFERSTTGGLMLNGLQKEEASRILVYIQKTSFGNKNYIAVCPHTKCIDAFA
jgi:hypothetical protein